MSKFLKKSTRKTTKGKTPKGKIPNRRPWNITGIRKKNHTMMTRSDTQVIYLRPAMMIAINDLPESLITEALEKLHKSIGVITLTNRQYQVLKPKLITWLESKIIYIKSLFETEVIATEIHYLNGYAMLKFPNSLKEKLDNISVQFFKFLKQNGCLTPGTEENIPEWVIKLPEGEEKEMRIQLHYKYGTANAPPLQSQHVTIDYESEVADGTIVEVKARLTCYNVGVYHTNHLGQLIGEPILSISL